MEETILKLLRSKASVPANVDKLATLLGLPEAKHSGLRGSLKRLERAGRIIRAKGFRFALAPEGDLIAGRIQLNRQRKGFFTPDDENLKEIFIPANATGTALHEDRVLVRPDDLKWLKKQPQAQEETASGVVVRVLERRRARIVGTLQEQKDKSLLYVAPDDPRIPADICIPASNDTEKTAKMGNKVVVEILAWEAKEMNPEGRIVEVLGPPAKKDVDMLSILRQYDLSPSFPSAVMEEAQRPENWVMPADLKDRADCRQHNVVTIDPDDAKDFDDAFCLQQQKDGCWKLWVHIADVSHYVQPGSPLDEEAQKRGNSTYLVDRVIPMFPEVLSNDLCSLKPKVDRLTKCIEFLLREDGAVIYSRYYSAIIRSKRRLTYGEALKILKQKPKDQIGKMIHQANKLAQFIRRRRFQAGSLEFDFPESKIILNKNGAVKSIERVKHDISHQLIEEFMILTNEAVAWRLMRRQRAETIYRVHEPPSEEKLRAYQGEVLACGVPCGNLKKPKEVQKLFRCLAVLPTGKALKISFLKSLKRARYDMSPLGHYGLAKPNYTHFTSPIRRYADLVVHRSLFDNNKTKTKAKKLKAVAAHISMTERNSAEAERDSKEVKLFAYLNAQLKAKRRKLYAALVVEIRNYGFFVEVEDIGLSGFVPLSILEDDFYIYDTTRHLILGRTSRRTIQVGMIVRVKVAKVNNFKKQVDFLLVSQKKVR